MPRSTMAALITETRTLINDPAGGSEVFGDDDVQNALDRRRTEQRFLPLQPSPSFAPGGTVFFYDFYANTQHWEDDVVLQDVGYNYLTSDAPEPIVGHWHFATQPNGFGVRATGKTYDIYGAAADLLEAWAAKVTLDFQFAAGKDQFYRQQKFGMLTQLAAEYRKRALAVTTISAQDEVEPGFVGPAVTYPTYAEDW